MISKEEVEGLAALARLDLSSGEVVSLQQDISNILDYVETISTAPMPDGEALRRGQEKIEAPLLRNILRADALREKGDAMAGKEQKIKEAFPKREGDYNVVRKIIQKDE
ncbi:MAG TPA: Asp-tRNA(Asn)/Glu-tRNA(Gln) amidotransferase subunit GatC [Candidatus Paceibacterota bacterium]